MLFTDRRDAGAQLAEALVRRGYEKPIVLGIPRGGVEVAAEVADALDADLGVVVAKKLRAPRQEELAIGAVAADGSTYVDSTLASLTGANEAYLRAEIAEQSSEARRREERFDGHLRPSVADRTVLIVDDGLATGATAIAAARSMRAAGALRVVLAVPVGSPRTVQMLRREVDEVVCLSEDPDFFAVGQFYIDFHQLDDGDVDELLGEHRRQMEQSKAAGAPRFRRGRARPF